jgi:hypothetical protein
LIRRPDYTPLEHLLEVVETSLADPAVFVQRAVPLVENIRVILNHELRPAKLTVIVIPVWVRGITAINLPTQFDTLEISLLSLKSPIS